MQQCIFESEAERDPELLVVARPDEIGEADPSRRLDERPVVKRHPDHLDERIGGESEHEQKRRREVEKPDEMLLRLEYMSARSARGSKSLPPNVRHDAP